MPIGNTERHRSIVQGVSDASVGTTPFHRNAVSGPVKRVPANPAKLIVIIEPTIASPMADSEWRRLSELGR
jgi:hypothetical protein